MKLHEIAEKVETKEDFIEFVKKLRDDIMDENEKEKMNPSSPYDKGVNGWENKTIAEFLDAIASFGEDNKLINEEPSWKGFAILTFAGKFYE